MKAVPNHIIAELCRYLPMLIDATDKESAKNNLRLANAIRVTKYHIIPKLNKINKQD